MGDFIWTPETTEKFFHLRLQNDWLFKKKKQAWKDFYNLLLDNGFPKTMTLDQVRKKWEYTFSAYKEAKSNNRKSWLYYEIFEKYLGKNPTLDRYDSWSDEWLLKFIESYQVCFISKGKHKNNLEFWREIEKELRSSGLPSECSIQDIQGLYHHLKMTFERKYKLQAKNETKHENKRKRPLPVKWPLFDAMLSLYENCEPRAMDKLQKEAEGIIDLGSDEENKNKKLSKIPRASVRSDQPLMWTRDLTESFIQFRLQHEWLFRQKKRAWDEFVKLMEADGLTNIDKRNASRKWNSLQEEYQKALATNKTNWIYYDLFQLYADNTDLNPLRDWQEYWVRELISARIRNNNIFEEYEDTHAAWREVEKDLRDSGIPLDHSLLDLQTMWDHLVKTFRWKSKFAAKGVLTEEWLYYDAMEKYAEIEDKKPALADVKVRSVPDYDDAMDLDGGFDEEDIKPLCHISKMEVMELPVEIEQTSTCRACGVRGADKSLFGETGMAHKMAAIAGIKVDKSDGLSANLCSACVEQLEAAFHFRLKCQATDKQQRLALVKVERLHDDYDDRRDDDDAPEVVETKPDIIVKLEKIQTKPKRRSVPTRWRPPNHPGPPRRPKKPPGAERKKYSYTRICEVCGQRVHNLKDHMAAHTGERSTCAECGKSFKYNSGLSLHMLVAHSNVIAATCNVCGKTFKTKAAYRKHYAYHADERQHCCETCGKGFNSKDILIVHMRMHTDERPFACPECGKRFRTMGCVSRHKRIVHKIASKVNIDAATVAVQSV